MAVLAELEPATAEGLPAGRRWRTATWIAILVAYGSLLTLVIPRHEPWFDEAQAWLIARDTDPLGLFRILPYEGQPGLWQLLLMLPARLLPYRALNWISGLFGTLGAYVFVRPSPFPLAVKVLVPFTYFFFYQYGVVARNYALLPVVLFSLAAIYPKRHEHPAQFALFLFVMANTSTHGFLIAGTLLGILTAEALRDARKHLRRPRRSEALSILLLGLAMGAIALSMIPPPDRSFATNRAGMVNPRSVFTSAGGMLNRSMADNRMVLLAVMAASVWFLRSRRVLHLYALPTLAVLALFAFVHKRPGRREFCFSSGSLRCGWACSGKLRPTSMTAGAGARPLPRWRSFPCSRSTGTSARRCWTSTIPIREAGSWPRTSRGAA